MTKVLLLILMLSIQSVALAKTSTTGVVSLSPVSKAVNSRMAGKEIINPNFSVKIDNTKWYSLTGITKPIAVKLPLNSQHSVTIKSNHKVSQNFKFRFSDYGQSTLRLSYDEGFYETWRLMPSKNCLE